MTSYSRLDEAWLEPFSNWQQPGLGLNVENADLLTPQAPVVVPVPPAAKPLQPVEQQTVHKSNTFDGPVLDRDGIESLKRLHARLDVLERSIKTIAEETKRLKDSNNTDLYTFIAVGVIGILVLDMFSNKK